MTNLIAKFVHYCCCNISSRPMFIGDLTFIVQAFQLLQKGIAMGPAESIHDNITLNQEWLHFDFFHDLSPKGVIDLAKDLYRYYNINLIMSIFEIVLYFC